MNTRLEFLSDMILAARNGALVPDGMEEEDKDWCCFLPQAIIEEIVALPPNLAYFTFAERMTIRNHLNNH